MSVVAKSHLLSQRPEEEEEEIDPLPFAGIEKSAVLQQCRCFNDISVNVHKCMVNMTKVLYLVNNGVPLSSMEASDVFFSATKLFQNDDPKMRRLLFVFLKDLAPLAEQVFIASSSLVKDVKGHSDVNRANAIRTLRKVIDSSVINTVDRCLKEAVLDRHNNVVSAALVTGIHLAHTHPDIVKHWGVEVSEALKNRGSKAQYHALALLHKLRKNDRLSVMKLVKEVQNGMIRSPLALCLLIRMCGELLQEDFQNCKEIYTFLTTSLLHNTTDMVVIEAAHAICGLRNVSSKEVVPAILAISPYLNSHKPIVRYTTIRILSKVAATHPIAVAPINSDIEALVNDQNRNIATLAITTLLKIGNEFSIERLLRQLTGPMMKDLSDDSKVVVVESMRVISTKFPSHYPILLDFLFSALRSESSGEFKHSVVETMVYISQTNPAAKEAVLTVLAKFIEDCEYVNLVKRVLCLIGEEGPSTSNPQQFIRYICNHVQLESPLIRAVGVTTLAKFGAAVPELRKSVAVLLRRTMNDPDDEVRDRAVFYYKLFMTDDEVAIRTLVTDVTTAVNKEREALLPKPAVVKEVEEAQPMLATAAAEQAAAAAGASGGSVPAGPSADVLGLRDKMRRIPQLKKLGEPSRTTESIMLTEQDNEYVVSVAKHLYPTHIVLQFKIANTMDNMSLCQFNVLADTEEVENATPLYAIPVETIAPGEIAYAYMVLECEEGTFPNGMIKCGCSFAMKEDGEEEAGDVEEFPIDEFAINVCDYITPLDLGESFEKQWTALRAEESVDTYSLKTMRNLTQAAHAVVDFFGMHVEGGRPEKITVKSQVINMAGIMADSGKTVILISAKVYVAADNTVALQLAIRGGTNELRNFLSIALMS